MSEDRPRIRELGVFPGSLSTGEDNSITDIPGVQVGHETVIHGQPTERPCVRSGVSVIDPDSERSIFTHPVTGATNVLNGYGKSVGFPQINELGEIETPITLTNTLSTWRVADAVINRILEANQTATSVNPVVGECNDGVLNDIRGRHISANHVDNAFDSLSDRNTQEGCVGAGVGTTGFGWKAGVGTSSRQTDEHTVGVLVLTNTGKPEDLRIDGIQISRYIQEEQEATSAGGSIMMILGTDATLSARQLTRVLKRTTLGLGRAGGIAHHGSGDFAVGFSNGHSSEVVDSELTPLFRGAVEATEEAIYNSLTRAETITGYEGKTVEALPVSAIQRAVDINNNSH